MNKISKAFQNKKAFIGFITAGDPDIATSKEIILQMSKAGCDLIEIGIPFSDPIAEGEVINNANIRALANGVTTDTVFSMVKEMSQKIDTPMVIMTYLNVLFRYGYNRFFQNAKNSGICGVIIPDLPFEEKREVADIAEDYKIDVISLIAPTSESRIKVIAKEAQGFIYTVSSLGVTGVRSEIKTDLNSIATAIREVTNVPIAIGFGISTPEQAKGLSTCADGIIVGSAIVKIIEKYKKDAPEKVFEYVKTMKSALL